MRAGSALLAVLVPAVLMLAGCGGDRRGAGDPPVAPAPAPLTPDGLRALSVYFTGPQAERPVVRVTHLVPPMRCRR